MLQYDTTEDTTVVCQNEPFELYIREERIQRRLRLIGRLIDDYYSDRKPILVGVLNGAFMVLADLMRNISTECEVDFIKLSSYGADKVSSGDVTQLKQIDADLTDRDVLVVEDIVDSGLSMQYLTDRLEEQNPRSVRVFTLLYKPEAVEHDVPLDYVGFKIPDRFVIGYGLDYGQVARNLPHIYIRVREDGHLPMVEEPPYSL